MKQRDLDLMELEGLLGSSHVFGRGVDAITPILATPTNGCSMGVEDPEQRPDAAAENSSQKSCQDGMSVRGEEGLLGMSRTQSGENSSRGSIEALDQGSSQPQKMQECDPCDR